jgi:hypothetical protein
MVKGMNFKEPSDYTGAQYIAPIGEQPRFVYLKASSYAFANCFEIEKKLGKKFKKEWYIDQHIFNKMNATVNYQSESFEMLPTNEKRQIFMFDGYPY